MANPLKEIRYEINHLAHKLALRYEYDVRDSIQAELRVFVDSGADLNQLRQALNNIEAARKRL